MNLKFKSTYLKGISTLGLFFTLMGVSFPTQASVVLETRDPLLKVLKQGYQMSQKELKPVVVFDIDDTLLLTRYRTFAILKTLARQVVFKRSFPETALILDRLSMDDMKYNLKDILSEQGITAELAVQTISDYWVKHFFSNHTLKYDREVVGAASYVRALYRSGVHIVYLTGRDVLRMKEGTVKSLHYWGFPVEVSHTTLMLKPDPKLDDEVYKKAAIEEIKKIGNVISVLENEPRNLNLLWRGFPKATAIFLDTAHSSHPAKVRPGAYWIKDYRRKK